MKERLMEILDAFSTPICTRLSIKLPERERLAEHLIASGVIVPPCKVEPIITVIKKPFHNRIEVVKNTRYEWNEARFCFSKDEANRVEAEWESLAERSNENAE